VLLLHSAPRVRPLAAALRAFPLTLLLADARHGAREAADPFDEMSCSKPRAVGTTGLPPARRISPNGRDCSLLKERWTEWPGGVVCMGYSFMAPMLAVLELVATEGMNLRACCQPSCAFAHPGRPSRLLGGVGAGHERPSGSPRVNVMPPAAPTIYLGPA
jgi:hypothetical protein